MKAEDVISMFTNVNIHPVMSKVDKRFYRFLRHSWRLPFNTTPGRTLSFLVTAGEESKVIGIFSLASPAMWMACRDEALGYEKLDVLMKVDRQNKRRETKAEWCQRMAQCGMVDDCKTPHPLSGKFTLKEYIAGLRNGLVLRIHEFPVILFDDRPDLIYKAKQHGISLEKMQKSLRKTPIQTFATHGLTSPSKGG